MNKIVHTLVSPRSPKFLVDRFHWRGHLGCSRGYCLDAYKDKRINAINSQVNEQANSGSPENTWTAGLHECQELQAVLCTLSCFEEHGQNFCTLCNKSCVVINSPFIA